MTFERLGRWDWVAFGAALVLMFAMALDWYSTKLGEEARRLEEITEPQGGAAGEVERRIDEDARFLAEDEERNAWQPASFIDGILLVELIVAALAALASGFFRAAGRRFEPPSSPSTLAAVAGATAALLIAYRIVQEPGFDPETTVQAGAPLALLTTAVLAFASSRAMAAEEDGSAYAEEPAAAEAAPPPSEAGA